MIDFYNAFISYKHAKLDTAIAERVQNKLEHFHVPHGLKKKLKHQKITRIFRDKDELPITSDLTETITEALEKAEYLIVICSTNTKESIWVKREIATFLKTHTRDRILTVLCDGEPFEVIPEELLSMEKEVVDASGFPHTIKVPVEPLSCDYRFSKSKADKEELPRLASALLGCSYDELQRRRRQYRIRRAAAIVAAAFLAVAGIAGYSLYMTKKINDSYMEALRNKSVYLATESRELLDNDLRVDSVHLALAALPQDDKDKKPVTAAAVRALTEATAAYKSNSGNNFSPAWNYRTEYEINTGVITEDNRFIAIMDRTGKVYCWNTLSHELVFEQETEIELRDIMFLGNDTILFTCADHLEAYNIQTGTLIWNYYSPEDLHTFNSGDVVFADNFAYVDNGAGQIVKLSIRDGKEKESYELFDDDVYLKDYYNLAVSSDGKKIAFTDSDFAFMGGHVFLYDTETKKSYSCGVDVYVFQDLSFADNDHLCLIAAQDFSEYSIVDINEYSTSIGYAEKVLYVFDGNLNELWNATLGFNNNSFSSGTLYIPSRDAVVFYVGNKAEVYDLNSGTVLNTYNTGSAIIAADDYNMNGLPEFICRHGEYVFATQKDSNSMVSYDSLCNKISFGIIADCIYASASGSSDLIAYNRFLQDDEWSTVRGTEDNAGSVYMATYSDDDYLVIAASINEAKGIRFTVIDPNDGTLRFSKDIEVSSYLTSVFEIRNIGGTLYACCGSYIYQIDPENETVKMITGELDYNQTISNGKIITTDNTFSGFNLTVTELDGSDPVEFTYEKDSDDTLTIKNCIYVENAGKVFVITEKHLYAADLSSGNIEEVKIPDSMVFYNSLDSYATASVDGSQILITNSNMVLVIDGSLKELYSFHCKSLYRFSAAFIDKTLYVVSDEHLLLYNSATGELIKSSEISLFGRGELEMHFNDKNHELILKVGDQASIFDTNEWVETAFIENCYCYHEPTDRFFVYSYLYSDTCTVGYIRHYSLDDLIEKANKYLGTHELDEETKAKYGLS